MKFDCGERNPALTDKERRALEKWKESARRWKAKRLHLTVWHRFYAWYPVRLQDHDCRWLEWVERKLEFWSFDTKGICQAKYRAPGAKT